MLIKRFFTLGLAINSYLVYDQDTGQGALIDPTRAIDEYIAFAIQHNIEITHILETHVHADFVSGSLELKRTLENKPTIYCSSMGGPLWSSHYADHLVKDRDNVHLGSIRLEAWHTPGHTPEHLIWVAYDEKSDPKKTLVAFTGDLLFVGSVGRPDLLGEQNQELLTRDLYHTLFEVLKPLPDQLVILPGHGAGSLCGKEISMKEGSTLGEERKTNPWLQNRSFDEWSSALLQNISSPPAYFQRMKQVNVRGMAEDDMSQELPLEILPEAMDSSYVVIDTRHPDAFAQNHIPGSINVPFGPAFALWAGIAVPADQELVLVVENEMHAATIIQSLKLIGLDRIRGIISPIHFTHEMEKSLHSGLLHVETLKSQINQWQIIDIRSPSEWQQGHIKEAMHIEMTEFPAVLEKLSRKLPIAVICRSGMRASVVTSMLQKANFPHPKNVKGGMQAWINAGFPLEK